MPTEQSPPSFFADNWAYLKTELNWLDRLLMVAVSRYRKDIRGIDRVAQTAADRVSSHWWRGMIFLDGKASYDDQRPPILAGAPSPQRGRYQQQLEERIHLSQGQGVVLALPLLCDRLQLSVFEKNLLLLALAPEVNRRYGHIYRFLQGEEGAGSDLPTVDLVLRLLCRNDQEWRRARQQVAGTSLLLSQKIVRLLPTAGATVIGKTVQLIPEWAEFLLAETPTQKGLESLLYPPLEPAAEEPQWLLRPAIATWDDLILPAALHQQLQRFCQLAQATLNSGLGDQANTLPRGGAIALLAGAAGTGKTLAAEAIAQSLKLPLKILDLAHQDPELALVSGATEDDSPAVVLVRSAELWLRRRSGVAPAAVQRWLERRQQSVTLLSVTHAESVALRWSRQWPAPFRFSVPDLGDRQRLWQQICTQLAPVAEAMAWEVLARQVVLTGGEIRAIAQTAIALWADSGDAALTPAHFSAALAHHGHVWQPPNASPKTALALASPSLSQTPAHAEQPDTENLNSLMPSASPPAAKATRRKSARKSTQKSTQSATTEGVSPSTLDPVNPETNGADSVALSVPGDESALSPAPKSKRRPRKSKAPSTDPEKLET